MRSTTNVLLFGLLIVICSCNSFNKQETAIATAENFVLIDNLLATMSAPIQHFSVPSDKPTSIVGEQGTVLHIIPESLITEDGTPLSESIEIELIELAQKSDLITHLAPTISTGKMLETGGAYCIQARSGDQLLNVQEGHFIKAEFPIQSDQAMELFYGIRNSTGVVEWLPTTEQFNKKNIPDAIAPKTEKKKVQKKTNDLEDILGYIDGDVSYQLTEEDKKERAAAIKTYKRRQKEVAFLRKTYEATNLMKLGWINCDRFYNTPATEKQTINVLVANDQVSSVRVFAIFKDIESVMCRSYIQGQQQLVFEDIPSTAPIQLIAIGANLEDQKIYLCQKDNLTAGENQQIQLDFEETTSEKIKAILAAVD